MKLLEFLAACVRADPAPSGLKGTIAIGVEHNAEVTWLVLAFGDRVDAHLQSARPRVDARLLLGHEEATLVLNGKKAPAQAFDGDQLLFRRFVARYLSRGSWLELRRRTPTKPKRAQR